MFRTTINNAEQPGRSEGTIKPTKLCKTFSSHRPLLTQLLNNSQRKYLTKASLRPGQVKKFQEKLPIKFIPTKTPALAREERVRKTSTRQFKTSSSCQLITFPTATSATLAGTRVLLTFMAMLRYTWSPNRLPLITTQEQAGAFPAQSFLSPLPSSPRW